MLARGGLRVREHHAGFGRHREAHGIDFAHAVQSAQREKDLPLAIERRGAAAIARVAALRHHAEPRVVAHAHDRRHLLHARRPHDESCRAAVESALVTQQRRRIGAREHAGGTHDAGDLCERCGVLLSCSPVAAGILPSALHLQRTTQPCHTRAPHRLRGMLRSDAEAEDVTQDAMLTVLTSLDRYSPREGARFAAWVASVAANTARRRFRRQRPELTETGELPDVPDEQAQPEREKVDPLPVLGFAAMAAVSLLMFTPLGWVASSMLR